MRSRQDEAKPSRSSLVALRRSERVTSRAEAREACPAEVVQGSSPLVSLERKRLSGDYSGPQELKETVTSRSRARSARVGIADVPAASLRGRCRRSTVRGTPRAGRPPRMSMADWRDRMRERKIRSLACRESPDRTTRRLSPALVVPLRSGCATQPSALPRFTLLLRRFLRDFDGFIHDK